jgi:hypothetical protein
MTTATTDNKYKGNLKLYGRARQAKNSDLKYSATIVVAGRICCSTKDDNKKRVKPRFSEVPPSHSCKATTVVTPISTSSAAAAIIGGSVTTTPTSSTIKNEQDENTTLYAFYYYHITAEDRKCSCYVCADLDAFKPKKQNDASLVYVTKKQAKRRAHA